MSLSLSLLASAERLNISSHTIYELTVAELVDMINYMTPDPPKKKHKPTRDDIASKA